MFLNSARFIPVLSSRYCGICWYFPNSVVQAASDSGGTTPVTGCHSVIDRPDRVSRVMPPITTIAKISAQQPNSHNATARFPAAAVRETETVRLADSDITASGAEFPCLQGNLRIFAARHPRRTAEIRRFAAF